MSGALKNPTVEIISAAEVSALAAEIVSVANRGATALSALASGFEAVNGIMSLASPATGIVTKARALQRKLFIPQSMRWPVWPLHGSGNRKSFPSAKAKSFRFGRAAGDIVSFAETLKRKLFPSQTMRWPTWPLHRVFKAKSFRFENSTLGEKRESCRGSVNLPFTPVAKQPRRSPWKVTAEAAAAIMPIA